MPIAIPSDNSALQQWSATQWGQLVRWCEEKLRQRRRLSPIAVRELEVLQDLLWKLNRLPHARQRVPRMAAVHTQLKKMQTMPTGSVRDAGRDQSSRQTQGGSQNRGTGEAMAVYNRLQQVGKNLSFEESVALRQGGRRTERKLLSQIDRASASGQDDIDDLDW